MMRAIKWAALAIFLTGSLALADITGGGGPGLVVNAINAVFGVSTALLTCDGVTDNVTILQAALTRASTTKANTVFLPPALSKCLLSTNVAIPSNVSLWAFPGSVIIAPTAGNVASPLLVNMANTSNTLIYGVTFDGGGTGFANTNNVVQAFNASNAVLDHVVIQNTAGVGYLLSTTTTNSGARDSVFTNVGASYNATFTGTISGTTLTFPSNTGTLFVGQSVSGSGVTAGTSIVSGAGLSWVVNISQSVGPVAMTSTLEKQGIAFCCGVGLDTGGGLSSTTSSISGTTMTTGNSVSGIVGMYVYSNSTGSLPDTKVVSGSGTSWVVSQSQTVSGAHLIAANNSGNFVKGCSFTSTGIDSISYTQQRNFAAENNNIVSPGIGGAGIYDHSNDTSTVVGNTILGTSTSGNGIDQAATFHTVITGNSSKYNGGSGIAVAYASHGVVSGNVSNNNGQNGLTGEGSSVAGLFLTGTTSPLTNIIVSGNDFSDVQSTPTQQFGIEMQTGSTFSSIGIDPNNNIVGNVVSPLSSLLTPLPSNLFNTTNPAGSGFSVTVTTAVASPGVVVWTAHGFKCLAPVYFSNSGGGLPTGISAFTTYYVTCGASLSANQFSISTTEALALAGTQINFAGSSTGTQTGHTSAIISSGQAFDIVGVPLAAGNYICQGIAIPAYGGSTSVTVAAAWISTAGASTLPYNNGTYAVQTAGMNDGLTSFSTAAIVTPQTTLTTLPVRVSLTSAGMAILAYEATYTVSSETVVSTLTCTPSR